MGMKVDFPFVFVLSSFLFYMEYAWRLGIPRSFAIQLTPRNVMTMQTKPSMLRAEARPPLHFAIVMACRYNT
jgi:hypothetical protein